MSEDRLDKILVQVFPELTRSKVQSLISKSKIEYKENDKWVVVEKPSQKISINSKIEWRILDDDEVKYVSRGALKLQEALIFFKIDVKNLFCLDIGLSTGGFSDLLLQREAKKILGIDVGREQLHNSLKNHPQLMWKDKINGRNPLPQELLANFFHNEKQQLFDLIVIDVSFISLEMIVPHLIKYLHKEGKVVTLVKPQFELSRSALNKKGVVKDSSVIAKVLEKMSRVFAENELKVVGECASPIEGENGNKEVLILAQPL